MKFICNECGKYINKKYVLIGGYCGGWAGYPIFFCSEKCHKKWVKK